MLYSRSILFCPTYKVVFRSRVGREVAILFTQAASDQLSERFPSGQMPVSVDETQLRRFPSGQMPVSVDETQLRRFPSGQSRLSPDEMTFSAFPSGENHDLPDGRPVRLARRICKHTPEDNAFHGLVSVLMITYAFLTNIQDNIIQIIGIFVCLWLV